MKVAVIATAVVILSCAAFAVTTPGGSWNILYAATSFSVNLSNGDSSCTNAAAVVGGSSVAVGNSLRAKTECIFRNAGQTTRSNLLTDVLLTAPQSTNPNFTGGANVFSNFTATPIFNGGNTAIFGVIYLFFGGVGARPCPGPTCEPEFLFGEPKNATAALIPNVPEPASLVLTGSGLLLLSWKVRKRRRS